MASGPARRRGNTEAGVHNDQPAIVAGPHRALDRRLAELKGGSRRYRPARKVHKVAKPHPPAAGGVDHHQAIAIHLHPGG
jgi:hypothetical protein